jgi:hypothetical protein
MDFTLSALLKTVRFYESKLLLLPFAGLVLVSLAAWTGGRRAWVGLVAMLGFFVPLAFLPGRLFSAYTYVPLVGAAIAFSALARRERAALAAVFFALWIPWNIFHLKANRRSALTIAEENRRYVQALGRYLQSSPETKVFIYDGRPLAFAQWGIEGAIRWFTGDTNREVYSMEAFDVSSKLQSASVAVLSWDPAARTLRIVDRQPGAAGAAFIEMTPGAPVWQLGHGWYATGGRRMAPPPWRCAPVRSHVQREPGTAGCGGSHACGGVPGRIACRLAAFRQSRKAYVRLGNPGGPARQSESRIPHQTRLSPARGAPQPRRRCHLVRISPARADIARPQSFP